MIVITVLVNSCFYVNGTSCFPSIISFGDSLADTGNMKQLALIFDLQLPALSWPNGEDFYDHSTGRSSNGRLIIDFLAESLGLPLVPPFLHDKDIDNAVAFRQGVNFAVGGASALDPSVLLEAKGLVNPTTNVSLRVQLEWFKQSLPSICGNASDCRNFIGSSLFLVGEIGQTDYNMLYFDGNSVNEVVPFVPLIVDSIVSTINELIEMGAQTLVVPGILPLGCLGTYLTTCGSEMQKYDPATGCLIALNEFAEYQNELLQTKLIQIRELHPNVNIIYADYYGASMQIIRSPDKFGFTNGALKACCGGGGLYNVNMSANCGAESASACDQPDTYVSWDGVHFTEAAYKLVARNLFEGAFTTPQFNSLCHTSILLSSM
ncbi:GDSL esterase/lipase At1g28580-like [Rutidosis leptorrhynchoides]|uniref:GDSL esterase/lipase At1g28580-like n=1 Tax=Rutidosis leptorrhynchoides TaxID=125765 RepID=UPI003A98EF3E